MKKLLLLVALAAFSIGASALQEIPIPSGSRVATTTYSADMFARKGDTGITVNNNVTSLPNASSLTLTIQAKTPQGAYYDVLSSAATVASTSTFIVIQAGQGLPVTSNLSVNVPMPAVFRIKSVLDGTATYSIGVTRSPQ